MSMVYLLRAPSPTVTPTPVPGGTRPLQTLLPYGVGGVLLLALSLWAAKQFFGRALQELGSRFSNSFVRRLSGSRALGGTALRRYRKAIQANYAEHPLGFVEGGVIDIRRIYVPLQYETENRREDIYERVRGERRTVIVGSPGGGKSLLLKNSMLVWAAAPARVVRSMPVLIDLHRCNDSDRSLTDLIVDELDRNQVRRSRAFTERSLQDGRLRLLFDGLDEVGRDDQDWVVQLLKDFAGSYPECQMIVTCRSAVYHGQLAPRFQHIVQVADFDDAGIRRFLGNWPGLAENEVEGLFAALRRNPQLMRLAASPLLLTMMVYLHTEVFAKTGRTLPTSRPAFYEIAIDHLLRRDRDLVRHKALSAYDGGDKKAVLQRVALALQEAPTEQADRRSIDRPALIAVIKELLPDLNLEAPNAGPLIDEIVDRSQLLVKLDRRSSRYAFRHLTLQEYLAAVELAAEPDRLLERYRYDPNGWRETVKLWCGASSRDCTKVVAEIFSAGSDNDRILAFECLTEARRIDEQFAQLIISHFERQLGEDAGTREQAIVSAFGAVASDTRPRGRAVFTVLATAAGTPSPRQVAALWALAATRLPQAADRLSGLIDTVDEARLALRSMGEQAVPTLGARAEAGHLSAVDDLAVIGTPAAAVALSRLVLLDGEVAVRAAWRLASLVTDPNVETALRSSAPIVPHAARGPEWVGAAFRDDGSGPLPGLMSRVGYLLDNSTEEQMPADLIEIDVRLAVPVGVVPATRSLATNQPLPGSEVRMYTRQLTIALDLRVGPGWWHDVGAVLLAAGEADASTDARRLCSAVLAEKRVPSSLCRIIGLLPWPVLAAAVARVFCMGPSVLDERDWVAAQQEAREPLMMARLLAILIGVTGLFVVAVGGIYRPVRGISGGWPWGPVWLDWAALSAICVGILLTLAIWSAEVNSDSNLAKFGAGLDELDVDFLLFVVVAICIAGLGTSLVLTGVTVAAWVGCAEVAIVGVTLVGIAVLLGWQVSRRRRAVANPLRQLLAIGNQTSAGRISVIAG